MQSIKNHISLVLALVSILFAVQTLIVTNRAIDAYENNLKEKYSIVVVAKKALDEKKIKSKTQLIDKVVEISIDSAIKKIDPSMSQKNRELLKLTLPKFYKVSFSKYLTSNEIERVIKQLKQIKDIKQVEDFKAVHDVTYKLLILFQIVVEVFSIVVFVITSLLIAKELRIWQYIHNDRMNIMGLFGAPKWLSSAVLFRLAIVDAIISSILIFIVFSYIAQNQWLIEKLKTIDIEIAVFDYVNDFSILFGTAFGLSLLLASAVVFGHKEEV